MAAAFGSKARWGGGGELSGKNGDSPLYIIFFEVLFSTLFAICLV